MIRAAAYGGGVQSNAILVLTATGVLQHDVFLFANVGDDSEDPLTLMYVRDVAIPYAKEHGLDIEILDRVFVSGPKAGQRITLWEQIHDPSLKSPFIPARYPNGKPGPRRCTEHFKIRVLDRWLRAHGASKKDPCQVSIGISTDEFERAKTYDFGFKTNVYPLLDMGISRDDCKQIIADAGLPEPPPSSCYFCPFHTPAVFDQQRRERPELFQKSIEVEQTIIDKQVANGKTPLYLTRYGRPLAEVFVYAPADAGDDEGYRCGDVCDT